ncbi:MAG: hypothetical protein KAT71_01685, partial [Gammaproteobacteria bacterium]|nr:hypothetical protein [Gammaproteobacteria bacterium]
SRLMVPDSDKDLEIYLDYTQPVSSSFPPPTPGVYVVVSGDTFPIIAKKTYGDQRYAGLIAENNGWTVSDTPAAGQLLQLPQIIPSINPYTATIPYQQFMSLIMGSIYPDLDTPQPPKHHHFLFGIVEIVAAVIICIAVPEAAAIIFSKTGITKVIGAAVGGALADAADQGIAIAAGYESSFSFTAMLRSGFEFGVGMGIGLGLAPSLKGLPTMEKWATSLLAGATINVGEQLTEMALGLREQFDYNWVITQAIGFGVNVATMGESKGARAAINSVSRGITRSAVYQKPMVLTSLAASAVGVTTADATLVGSQALGHYNGAANSCSVSQNFYGDTPYYQATASSVSQHLPTSTETGYLRSSMVSGGSATDMTVDQLTQTGAGASKPPFADLDQEANQLLQETTALDAEVSQVTGQASALTSRSSFWAQPGTSRFTLFGGNSSQASSIAEVGFALAAPPLTVPLEVAHHLLPGLFPDFLTVSGSFTVPTHWTGELGAISFQATLDRYGDFYAGGGLSVGKTTKEYALSATANWMSQSTVPSQSQLEHFISGTSYEVGVGYDLGMNEQWVPGYGAATGVGYFTPQIGGSVSYSREIFHHDLTRDENRVNSLW